MNQDLLARLGMWTNVDNDRKIARSHQIDYSECIDCTYELDVRIIDIASRSFDRG